MVQGSVQGPTQGAAQHHACGHDHAGTHVRVPPEAGHHHAPSTPHPAQAVPWSLLRMGVSARLGGALLIASALWVLVLTTLRPL